MLLNIGFLEGFLPGEIGDIARGLTYLSKHQGSGELFASPLQRYSSIVRAHIERFWKEILESGRIDVAHKSLETAKAKARNMVDLDTIEHTEARDVGAENLCLQALRQLKLDDFLATKGWDAKKTARKLGFGRSKEKRSDCKLVVLALCVNAEGFLRYSSILEGNTSDPSSLPNMIDNLIAKNPTSTNPNDKVLVVLDAGISTDENLKLIKDKEVKF